MAVCAGWEFRHVGLSSNRLKTPGCSSGDDSRVARRATTLLRHGRFAPQQPEEQDREQQRLHKSCPYRLTPTPAPAPAPTPAPAPAQEQALAVVLLRWRAALACCAGVLRWRTLDTCALDQRTTWWARGQGTSATS